MYICYSVSQLRQLEVLHLESKILKDEVSTEPLHLPDFFKDTDIRLKELNLLGFQISPQLVYFTHCLCAEKIMM